MSDIKKRNCPKCFKELIYSSYNSWYNSTINNCLCRSCSKCGMPNGRLGKKHTPETKLKMSVSAKNQLPISDKTREKLSIARKNRITTLETRKKLSEIFKGRKVSDEHKIKLSESNVGKRRSEETKHKIRLATITDLTNKGIIGISKNYNPIACRFIDKLNKEKGWNLQYAENGGEVELYGYFVDGYDKEKNIIFEYDEPHHKHLNKVKKDIIRQNNLLREINPILFIRYDEIENKLYSVKGIL